MIRRLARALVVLSFASVAVSIAVSAAAPDAAAGDAVSKTVTVPKGFKIEEYARVPNARTMVIVPELDAILVGTRGPNIYAITGFSSGRKTDRRVVRVRNDRDVANGIDWRDGWLYVAEQPRVVRIRARSVAELAAAEPEILFDGLPDDSWHGWRYARFGPDGQLYISVGVPCNICRTEDLTGTIVRMPATGGRPEIYAEGVRNSVGFDFQPGTNVLHFTDNGADNMGDDVPPDELNRAPRKGLWFGFPHYGGGSARTDQFRGEKLPRPATYPVVEFNAHVAALGISFYRGQQFPAAYRNDAFVAQHGSWNRTVPDGYRVMRVMFDPGTAKVGGAEIFASGFLRPNGDTWGRPVDVKELPDGSILVSDDFRGAIYRISYTQP